MNSFKIFFDRVKRDGVFQYNIIKSVADWTVLLYMIIPAVAIAVSIYCSWWRELPPWTEQLPFSLWASIAFLICLVPRYRTYVQEADSVFLVHHRSLFLSMKTWAYFYSIMKALLQMMLFIVAVLPFLLKVYSFTVTEVVSFACFYMAVLLVSMSVKAILFRRFSGWRRYLMGGGCVVFLLIMNGFLLKDLSTHLFFSSIILVLLLFISFNHILNGNKFLFIFSKFLPRTAFLTMLAVRFVPLLKKRLDEITDVQRIKGLTIASGTLKQRCKDGMTLIQILLTWSLEEAIETADSMKTRGYGIGMRSPYIPYKLTCRDQVWLLLLVCLLIICLVGGALGYGRIDIYPDLGSLQLTWLDGLLLINTIIILSFPLLVEGREQLRWRLFQ